MAIEHAPSVPQFVRVRARLMHSNGGQGIPLDALRAGMSTHAKSRQMPIPATQRGAALLVSLILLVVITMVGLAAIGTTILQNKAAANHYDREIAFQAVEAALRQAEVTITSRASSGTPAPSGFIDCSPASANVCLADAFGDRAQLNANPSAISGVPASAFSAGPLAAMQPQFVIEYMGSFLAPTPRARQIGGQHYNDVGQQGDMANYYRITARSGDPAQVTGRAIVTLQSTFRN